MIRCRITRIGFIITVIMLSARPGSLSQSINAPPTPPEGELLVLKFSPGRWRHEVEGEVRAIETIEFRTERKNGRLIEIRGTSRISYFDRRGFETEMIEGEEARTVWKYDARGRPSEMSMSLAGVLLMREVYQFDFNQRKIAVEVYNFLGDRLSSREISFFDERWNETRKETEYFGDSGDSKPRKEVVIYTRTYDSKGRVTSSTVGREDGSILHRFTEEYDKASNRLVKSVSYQYDESSGSLLSKGVNTYDERGYLLEGLYYDSRGRLLRRESYMREFDQRGNWITERNVTWADDRVGPPGSFTLIKRRKITFY
jgi:hypothetical protein